MKGMEGEVLTARDDICMHGREKARKKPEVLHWQWGCCYKLMVLNINRQILEQYPSTCTCVCVCLFLCSYIPTYIS